MRQNEYKKLNLKFNADKKVYIIDIDQVRSLLQHPFKSYRLGLRGIYAREILIGVSINPEKHSIGALFGDVNSRNVNGVAEVNFQVSTNDMRAVMFKRK